MNTHDDNFQPNTNNSEAQLTSYEHNHFNPVYEDAYKILYKLMNYADEKNASDIFIAPDFPPAVKVNGILYPLSDKPYNESTTRELVYSIMTDKQIKEFKENLELNFAHKATDQVRFRINAYHEQGRVGMVLRKINMHILTIDELALPKVLKTIALLERGLVIVVGATGSGKSTTLAAIVDHRNKHSAGHIITIEDPIEFVHRHNKSIITQREIGTDTESWHTGLVNAMREAPNVVVVGEVRDVTAMNYAIQLTQTGHLCMCTLHATNSNQALERIINFYDSNKYAQLYMDLSMNLAAIVSQRLVVKKDGSGRTVAMDIMLCTSAIKDLISKGKLSEIREMMARSEDEGMQTFDDHLFNMYISGIIDLNEALRNADSINNLRLRIKLYESGEDVKDKEIDIFDLDIV